MSTSWAPTSHKWGYKPHLSIGIYHQFPIFMFGHLYGAFTLYTSIYNQLPGAEKKIKKSTVQARVIHGWSTHPPLNLPPPSEIWAW